MNKDVESRGNYEIGKHSASKPLPAISEAKKVLQAIPTGIFSDDELAIISNAQASLAEAEDLFMKKGISTKEKGSFRRFFNETFKRNKVTCAEILATMELQTLGLEEESIRSGSGWGITHVSPYKSSLFRELRDGSDRNIILPKKNRYGYPQNEVIFLDSDKSNYPISTQIEIFMDDNTKKPIYVIGNVQKGKYQRIAAYQASEDKTYDTTTVVISNPSQKYSSYLLKAEYAGQKDNVPVKIKRY